MCNFTAFYVFYKYYDKKKYINFRPFCVITTDSHNKNTQSNPKVFLFFCKAWVILFVRLYQNTEYIISTFKLLPKHRD